MAASVRGRAALRKRGGTVERSFEHVLDEGGGRRTTLRGQENIAKPYFLQAAGANLSLLLRALGVPGTLRQTWAAAAALSLAWEWLIGLLTSLPAAFRPTLGGRTTEIASSRRLFPLIFGFPETPNFSTAC